MVELGLPGITVPEAHDGLEFGWMGLGAIAQEAGRCLVASPLLSSVVLAQNLLLNCGSDAQIANYLPSLMSGEGTATVALDEGRFFNPDAVATSDASGTLNGQKVGCWTQVRALMCSVLLSKRLESEALLCFRRRLKVYRSNRDA